MTDFPNETLIRHEKVLTIPHLGASTPEAADNCTIMAVGQLRDFLEHGNITNAVNFPACQLPRPPEDFRLVIANKNEPNMIGQFTTILAEHRINIADMINKGREDSLVDERALLRALDEGILAAYVTDFPNETLIRHEKVLTIPHLGASTPEAADNCTIMAVGQLRDFLEHGNITNAVNFPACQLPRPPEDFRLVIANKNEPNMIGQFTTILAEHRINIADMINKGREDLAYNIIDVDTGVGDDVLAQLHAINGVIMVHSLAPVSAAHPAL